MSTSIYEYSITVINLKKLCQKFISYIRRALHVFSPSKVTENQELLLAGNVSRLIGYTALLRIINWVVHRYIYNKLCYIIPSHFSFVNIFVDFRSNFHFLPNFPSCLACSLNMEQNAGPRNPACTNSVWAQQSVLSCEWAYEKVWHD